MSRGLLLGVTLWELRAKQELGLDMGEMYLLLLFYLLRKSGGMNDEVMALICKSLWIWGAGLKHGCMVQQREMRGVDGLKPCEHRSKRNAYISLKIGSAESLLITTWGLSIIWTVSCGLLCLAVTLKSLEDLFQHSLQ